MNLFYEVPKYAFYDLRPVAMIATERANQANAEAKIKVLEEQIAGLK